MATIISNGITLSDGTTTINLPNPSTPYKEQTKAKQKMLETENGTRYVYDYGVKRKVFELKWKVLFQTEFNQLKDFIENTVNFKEIPFTYTDFNGVSYNVRAITFSHSQTSPVHYEVSLKLEQEV